MTKYLSYANVNNTGEYFEPIAKRDVNVQLLDLEGSEFRVPLNSGLA